MVALRGMIFPLAGCLILGNVMRRDIAAENNLGELNITLFYATHSQLHKCSFCGKPLDNYRLGCKIMTQLTIKCIANDFVHDINMPCQRFHK